MEVLLNKRLIISSTDVSNLSTSNLCYFSDFAKLLPTYINRTKSALRFHTRARFCCVLCVIVFDSGISRAVFSSLSLYDFTTCLAVAMVNVSTSKVVTDVRHVV